MRVSLIKRCNIVRDKKEEYMAKILAVDDQPDNLELLCQILEESEHTIVMAQNGNEALAKAREECPDVILLDIQMPQMDGFQVCTLLKKDEKTRDIPIIFLTAQTGEHSVVKGLDLGAYDYITKPFNERELVSRVSVMLRIRAAEKKMENMALTDVLTGLYNRRFLYQRFDEEISRAKRNNNALSCLMLDIDFFKAVNDTHGHLYGDYVLKEVARLLKENLRGYDALVRFGGEEFVVLLPGAECSDAESVAKKIREKIEMHTFKEGEISEKITVSIGVFGCSASAIKEDAEEYIKHADAALYAAKESGRNKVVVHTAS
jgi:diguanylate cyclase (GGDEF)-like protein